MYNKKCFYFVPFKWWNATLWLWKGTFKWKSIELFVLLPEFTESFFGIASVEENTWKYTLFQNINLKSAQSNFLVGKHKRYFCAFALLVTPWLSVQYCTFTLLQSGLITLQDQFFLDELDRILKQFILMHHLGLCDGTQRCHTAPTQPKQIATFVLFFHKKKNS